MNNATNFIVLTGRLLVWSAFHVVREQWWYYAVNSVKWTTDCR